MAGNTLNADYCEAGYLTGLRMRDRGLMSLATGVLLDRSGVPVVSAANLSVQTLKTILLPAKMMGANGSLRFTAIFSAVSNGNMKIPMFNFAGAAVFYAGLTGWGTYTIEGWVQNRGAANAQVSYPVNTAQPFNVTSNPPLVLAVNTDQDVMLSFGCQMAVATDAMTLEAYMIEVFPS